MAVDADLDQADALWEAGRFPEAEAIFRAVLEQDRENSRALHHLGALCCQSDRFSEALSYLGSAADHSPDDPTIRHNLGMAYLLSMDFANAEQSFCTALSLRPNDPEIAMSLAHVLERTGRLAEAARLYGQIADVQREDHQVQRCAARCFLALERPVDALPYLDRAAVLSPEDCELALQRGVALRNTWRLNDAVACFQNVLNRDPDNATAHLHLGLTYSRLGEAVASYKHLQESVFLKPEAKAHSAMIRAMHYVPGIEGATMFLEHRAWAERNCLSTIAGVRRPVRSTGPWRIGFVSALFGQHASNLWAFVMGGSEEFEIYHYADDFSDGTSTAKALRARAVEWKDTTTLSNDELAKRVSDDGIDILVNCDGHYTARRLPLFGSRAAPVQTALSLYPGTTGLAEIDFQITDPVIDADQGQYHTESLIHVPAFVGFLPPSEAPAVSPPPSEKTGKITFGSFSVPTKINDDVVRTWSHILAEVPCSDLILHSYMPASSAGSDDMLPELRMRLTKMFESFGIAADRIRTVGFRPLREHLELYGQVDIALDPFPYNGVLTTMHALWMGVPVITLEGKLPVARAGCSILSTLGMSSWIAHSEREYVNLSIATANAPGKLSEWRTSLRSRIRSSPWGDTNAFSRHLRSAWLKMLPG